MSKSTKPIINFSYSLDTQPEMLERSLTKKSSIIGVPKEEDYQEKRVALTPHAVSVLVNNGQEVLIEHNAGLASSYNDAAYSEAGAKICYDKMEVFKSQLVLKTAPIHDDELEFIQANQIIISPLNIPSLKKSHIEKCLEKQIIGISLADIKDDAGNNPIVRSLSQIAGVYAINVASQLLTSSKNGKGILLGSVAGVPPSRIVILGAGIVGFSAVRAALALGAYIQVFDNSITRLMHLQQSFGSSLFTSVIDIGLIKDAIKHADVVIGCIKPEKGIVPIIVTEDMVEQMQPNSVIIDVSIDKGGCIETSRMTSHEKPTYK
ncbi:MAG: alanine dehydrogenase, partial [Chitinophagaceae bacterium]|nr:alanine dehydrogenase [Chitinophagaceae bacterium]